MVFDDFKQFAGINGKQQWPQTRSLWNAIRKLKTVRCFVSAALLPYDGLLKQSPRQALRFSQSRGERLVMNLKGPWEGEVSLVVSFPPSFARTFSSRGRDVWIQGSCWNVSRQNVNNAKFLFRFEIFAVISYLLVISLGEIPLWKKSWC